MQIILIRSPVIIFLMKPYHADKDKGKFFILELLILLYQNKIKYLRSF